MKLVYFILFVLLGLFHVTDKPIGRSYFQTPAFEADSLILHVEKVDFNDTIPNDTLFIFETAQGLIHSYMRKILTGVCIKGECRRINLELYWTVTGRFLGYVLQEGEFLSKTEHAPFLESDYKRLSDILANPYSILGKYQMSQLTLGQRKTVDGVTAATLASVKEETVPDAVYTTFTLWHLVYGETQKKLRAYSNLRLTDTLAIKILSSPDYQDKLWALQNMGPKLVWSDELKQLVLNEILTERDILANYALSSLPDSLLEDQENQLVLARGFSQLGYINQREFLDRLEQVSILSLPLTIELASAMSSLSANVAERVLDLFVLQHVESDEVNDMLCELLDHRNRFVARKVYEYLEKQPKLAEKVKRKVQKYQSKQS